MEEPNNVENFRADVGSCEESILSPVKVRKRFEKVVKTGQHRVLNVRLRSQDLRCYVKIQPRF